MIHRLGIVALVVLGLLVSLAPAGPGARAVGAPLYPDLKVLNPQELYFDTENFSGTTHYLLRFSSTVWNAGEGRLELQGDPNPGGAAGIYQNIYDAPTGGALAVQRFASNDYVYHPDHYHYHFEDFAEYGLLKRDAAGTYNATSQRGKKTSFCIMDYTRINGSGPADDQYSNCNATRQGLSVGWGDTYYASLVGQWVDLGTSPLADGDYAVRSVADPRNKLNEAGRDGNNVGVTYFSVRNGTLLIGATPPPPPARCSLSPTTAGVGASVTVSCQYFGAGEVVRIYWENTSSVSIASFLTNDAGSGSTAFTVPQAPAGGYTVFAVGSRTGARVSAQFGVGTSTTISPSSGPAGTRATVNAAGLRASEAVEVWFYRTATDPVKLVSTTASASGGLSAQITVPTTTTGSHKIEVIGRESGARSSATFTVTAGTVATATAPPSRPRGTVIAPTPTLAATGVVTTPPTGPAPTAAPVSRTIRRGTTTPPPAATATTVPGVPTATAGALVPTATSGAVIPTATSRSIRGADTAGADTTAPEPTAVTVTVTETHEPDTREAASGAVAEDRAIRIADQSTGGAPAGVSALPDLALTIVETTATSITVGIDAATVGPADLVEVAYGPDATHGSRVTALLSEDGTRYEATIDPVTPGTTYSLQVVVTAAGEERTGEDTLVTTLPAE